MDVYKQTKDILKKYNIHANKNLGQNFLIDSNIIDSIIGSSNITGQDLVIEIGPGLGTLTESLLEKAYKVICIELDKKMVNILHERFEKYDNIEILNEDILKVDLNKLIKEQRQKGEFEKVKIVANLPYYITTPIIMKLLENNLDIYSITIMVQLEVAERICAIPGDNKCGAITYCIYYYSQTEEIINVPNSSFIPEPKVISKVVKLKLRDRPAVEVKDKKLLFNLIKAAFSKRRKTLQNALLNSDLFASKDQIIQILNKLNIDEKIRGEKLTLEQYAQICNLISE